MPVYVVRPAILFGLRASPSAFIKGFASKSRRDGLLAKGELQTEMARRADLKIRGTSWHFAPPGIRLRLTSYAVLRLSKEHL